MSADDRTRLAKTYRDLDAADLLKLYNERNDLSELALEVLRDELKLRGLDPDSLRATVPKAGRDEDDESDAGELESPSDMPAVPDVPEELKGEFDPAKDRVLCPTCGAPNETEEVRCRACRALLPGAGGTLESPSVSSPTASGGAEPATLVSAMFGLMGLAGLVFGVYLLVSEKDAFDLGALASVIGAVCVGIATVLHRRGQRPGP